MSFILLFSFLFKHLWIFNFHTFCEFEAQFTPYVCDYIIFFLIFFCKICKIPAALKTKWIQHLVKCKQMLSKPRTQSFKESNVQTLRLSVFLKTLRLCLLLNRLFKGSVFSRQWMLSSGSQHFYSSVRNVLLA